MPLTPNQALPYFTEDDPMNGPDQQLALAQAIEPKLVMRFASAADRAARLPLPTEGMLCWLDDSNRIEEFTGAAWVEVPDLTKVNSLLNALGHRAEGPKGTGFANTSSPIDGASWELTVEKTISVASATRHYQVTYADLFYTTSAPAVVDVLATVTAGSTPSEAGDQIGSAQVPVVMNATAGGSRIPLVFRGTSWPVGNACVGIYVKLSLGTDTYHSGAKELQIDDVGS